MVNTLKINLQTLKNKNMKKLYYILIIIATFIFFACEEEEQSNPVELYDLYEADDVEQNFTKTFEGQLDFEYDIVMKISSNNGKVTGNYYYKNAGEELKLKGTIDKEGKVLLNEYNKSGSMTGLFEGNLYDDSKISGYWKKPDESKILTLNLTESFNDYEVLKNQKSKKGSNKYDGEYYSEYDFRSFIKIRTLSNNEIEYTVHILIESPSYLDLKGKATLKNNKAVSSDNSVKLTFNQKALEFSYYSDMDCDGIFLKN